MTKVSLNYSDNTFMRIDKHEIHLQTTNQVTQTNQTNQSENIRIGELMVQETETNENKIYGKSAEVEINNSEKSAIPGFVQNKIIIKTKDGKEFSVNLFVQGNTDPAQAKKLTEKLTKVIANLPPKTLDDMQQEMKHITICPNIIVNNKALALAIAPLNQIYLSASNMAELSEAEIENTLIHEQGHLADRIEGMFAGNFSRYFEKEFSELINALNQDPNINTNTHTCSRVGEFFADYYLHKNGTHTKEHRSEEIFYKLEAYKDDFQNLTETELFAVYGENVDMVKNIAKKWAPMSEQFDQYFRRLGEGDWDRINEKAAPMSVEQIIERNKKILDSEK